jgi:hypothetical protein
MRSPPFRVYSPIAPPLLLDALRDEPDFWFGALREITGENPAPESSAGKIDEMSQAWLEWGRARGLSQGRQSDIAGCPSAPLLFRS